MNDTIIKEENSPNAFGRAMRYVRPALLIIAIGLLVYLIYRAGPKELLDIVLGLSPAWIAATLFFGLLNLMLAALRYKSLAARELKYRQVFEVILASYLLNYASMVQGVGIGAKVGLICFSPGLWRRYLQVTSDGANPGWAIFARRFWWRQR
jgi:uncharacterized membrane protein YbhN (UPF0104 family)